MPEPAFFIRNIRKVTLSGVLHRNSTRGVAARGLTAELDGRPMSLQHKKRCARTLFPNGTLRSVFGILALERRPMTLGRTNVALKKSGREIAHGQ